MKNNIILIGYMGCGKTTLLKLITGSLKPDSGSIHIVDVAEAFKGHPEYIANDCVHPNAQGNVVIARVVLEKLSSLGLGKSTTPVIRYEGVNNRFAKPFKEFVYFAVELAEVFFPDLFII